MKKIILSWSDVEERTQKIADHYKEEKFDCIVGLSRGGLIPGVLLSHKLNLPLYPVVWQTRDGAERDVEYLNQLKLRFDRILVVDDIYDSGLTYEQVKDELPFCEFATLVSKKEFVGYSALRMFNKKWIVFPWENN